MSRTARKTLVEWMKKDWRLFSHESMDNAHAKELLGEILDNGEIVRKNFRHPETYKSEGLPAGKHFGMSSCITTGIFST